VTLTSPTDRPDQPGRAAPAGHARHRAAWSALLLLACLAGCGGTGSPEQKQALAKVQQLGGKVNFKRGGYEVDLSRAAIGPGDLAELKHIANLKNVVLQSTPINDTAIPHLQGITTLEYIDLRRTAISPTGIESLKKSLPNAQIDH
jgi:hypothetical protein